MVTSRGRNNDVNQSKNDREIPSVIPAPKFIVRHAMQTNHNNRNNLLERQLGV
jgi:hypothetical protein